MAKQTGQDRRSGPPTMTDVAQIAGVSQMTVSRVMRGEGYISAAVRDQVRAAASEIGYIHNRLAGGISAYDNPLVGVVLPTLQNRVFTEVLAGISDTLDEKGLRPVFGVSEYSLETEKDMVFDLLSWRPRGLILSGLEHTDEVRRIVRKTGVRTAEIMDIDGDPMSACFGFSQEAAGAEMARYLLSRGYRQFGYVGSYSGLDLRALKRFEAFAATVQAAGAQILAERVAHEPSSMLVGRQLTNEILGQNSQPEVLYYSNDDLAAGGLMHCLAKGIGVPKDLAIAGCNGLDFLDALPMRITTTKTPRFEIGAAAAAWVTTGDNAGAQAQRQSLETTIIEGDTA
ncbi:MAG: LacI family DNA-binding transcriptional regulator [Pseudomonadota bacterium]